MRTIGMIQRVLKQMLRDKRTLALMFIAPLLILTLMYFLFQNNATTTATIGVRNVDSSLVQAMTSDHLKVKTVDNSHSATHEIRAHDWAGMLTQKNKRLTLTLANDDQSKAAIIKQSLTASQAKLKAQAMASAVQTQAKLLKQQAAAIAKLQTALAQVTGHSATTSGHQPVQLAAAPSYHVTRHYLYGDRHSTFFDTLLPIMMGFVVFFFVFLISGIALLSERTTGTLDRLLATPVRRGEIISGYLAGYGLFALVQTGLIVGFTMLAFHIQILGSVWLVLLINILLAAVALTMGLLISTFAESEFQMVQFIPIVVLPQIFFSGIIPVNGMPNWLQVISHVMPLYYGADGLTAVVTKAAGIGEIGVDLLVLVGFAVLFLVLNVLTMRRYREV